MKHSTHLKVALQPLALIYSFARDEGKSWEKILEGLPATVCVRHAVVEEAFSESTLKPTRSRRTSPPAKSDAKSKSRATQKR